MSSKVIPINICNLNRPCDATCNRPKQPVLQWVHQVANERSEGGIRFRVLAQVYKNHRGRPHPIHKVAKIPVLELLRSAQLLRQGLSQRADCPLIGDALHNFSNAARN